MALLLPRQPHPQFLELAGKLVRAANRLPERWNGARIRRFTRDPAKDPSAFLYELCSFADWMRTFSWTECRDYSGREEERQFYTDIATTAALVYATYNAGVPEVPVVRMKEDLDTLSRGRHDAVDCAEWSAHLHARLLLV